MKVLITGGTGRIGRITVQRFLRNGHDVRVLDIADHADIDGAEYVAVDIRDFDATREAVRGCDAIVHLAAIAAPMRVPGHEIFDINVSGTFNVFEAAAAEGIGRIAHASSINAFGCFWGTVDIRPDYLPIDEAHPTFTTDVYSFSKGMVEEIGDYFWQRDGISSTAFRFPGVYKAEFLTDDARQQRVQQARAAIDDFAALPEDKRAQRLATLREATVAYRGARNMEFPQAQNGFAPSPLPDEPLWNVYAMERFNFWAYIDERDAAQALERGVTADYEGSHPLFANAENNSLGYDSSKLAELFFPEVEASQRQLSGTQSLVSIEQARALIGFAPEFAA